MRRRVILIIAFIVILVLVTSPLLLIELSKQPHIALISENTAEGISGQNYRISSLTTSTGIGLLYAPYGEEILREALYSNETQFTANGTFLDYFLQDDVMKFNTTVSAQTVYSLESDFLENLGNGIVYPVANATYKGFHYTYTTVSQKRYGSEYFWGTTGYSGNLVFEITGQSPLPPNTNMSTVAIDQINLMTSFYL